MKLKKVFSIIAMFMVVVMAGSIKDVYAGIRPIMTSTDLLNNKSGVAAIKVVVISASPTNGATDISLDKKITVTFNEKMNPATINQASFTLKGLTSVLGTVSYTDTTASFIPSSALTPNTTYTATVTTGAKSVSGTPLESDYVWTFRTKALGTPSDTSAVKSPVVSPPVGGTSPVVKPPVVVPPVVTPRKQ